MRAPQKTPQHIAIIMDGNGRWAKEKGLPRISGHRAGIDRVREIVRAAGKIGVKVLTLYAFSAENWSRPKMEIRALMGYLDRFLNKELAELNKNNVRLVFLGRGEPLPEGLLRKMRAAEDMTKDNSGLVLALALNYGSRQEIIDAARSCARQVQAGTLDPEGLDEEAFSGHLYTRGLPDPDLLIRTSGEMRLSNFLLWQLSYAELYFPRKYWPDFSASDLAKAVAVYRRRERRFGGL